MNDKHYRYETLDENGRCCCGSDDPNFSSSNEPQLYRCPKCVNRPVVNGHLRSASADDDNPPSPPDGYADALAKRGAPKPVCPYDDKHYDPLSTPPDGYAIAVARLKKENQR
jgi:hypothetical protein